jgi:hypothetical protein
MGTKMAPSYANIFMWKFEKQLLKSSIEILRAWLYGMLLVTWGGWQLLGKRYWLVSGDLEYKSVDSTPSDKELEVSTLLLMETITYK